jgi:hypothetical protein
MAEQSEETTTVHATKTKKASRWTLETCIKAARRFSSLDEWKVSKPDSYKAAVAKGWASECAKHFVASAAPAKTAAKGKKKTA